jgi:hypothetical protein
MYVPQELVPSFQKALKNAKKIEKLLYGQGPAMLLKYRRVRDAEEKGQTPAKKSKKNPSKS